MDQKVFSSALSKDKDWRLAALEVCDKIKADLGDKTCDLGIFFVSESFEDFDPADLSRFLTERLPYRVLLGCNSSGVIGSRKEIEMEPAISAMAMHLPQVRLYPFYLAAAEANALESGTDLINFLDIYPTDKPRFICLADPQSCDIARLLDAFNEGYKGLPVVGGLASGAVMKSPNWLLLNNQVCFNGAAGVAFIGDIEFETIVSQGCRPIGRPYVITKADENILYELGGRPAVEVLRELLAELAPKDRKLAEHSLSTGIVMNEQRTAFKRGDFLIRNILGFDPDSGALMIGALLKVGQTLQFQLRDAETSAEDLRILLQNVKMPEPLHPEGGLLVSCCGRGRRFYGKPDHDITEIQATKGAIPLAGFFANGEIGPVGNKNYVHGYTSSLLILR